MNQKDLEYLRTMAEKSETKDFSDKELERISSALRTNVNADDTTEALDLTAHIIYEQSQYEDRLMRKRNVDIEKLDGLAREIIDKGLFLGASDAVDIAKDVQFDIALKQAKNGTISKEYVNLERGWNGSSVLDDLLYDSQSPKAVKSLIDKGGNFGSETDSEEIKDRLIVRVTSGYKFQLQDFGEDNIKNNLGNLAVLVETCMIEKSEDLDRLLSNPELFEKYPNIMKKMFSYDKNLLEKLEDVKVRKENKEQNRDYLQDKLEKVRKALQKSQRRPRKEDERKKLTRNYRMGETGEVTRKNLSENNRPSKEEIEYGTQIQTEAAKKVMKERRGGR